MANGEVRLDVRVQPKASRNQLRVEPDGRVKLSVTAPPADGEANAAVCRLLAAQFGVSKSAVRIVRGETSREKTVTIAGISEAEFKQKLKELAVS